MDSASRTFAKELDRWLQKNTVDLFEADGEECPICGEYAGGDYHLIRCFGNTANVGISILSGPWDACSWKELRQCDNSDCNVLFIVENCNY